MRCIFSTPTFIGSVLTFSVWVIIPESASAHTSIHHRNSSADCHSEARSEIVSQASRICMSPESLYNGDCHEFMEELLQIDNPTPEQRRALVIGYHSASNFESKPERSSEMYQYVVNAMRSLVKDYPDDPRWAYELAFVEQDNDQKITLFQHVLELDPVCVSAAREIADILNDSDSDEDRAKALEYILYAYEHDVGEGKLYHALDYILYIKYLYEKPSDMHSRNFERRKAEDSFRTRVIEDMGWDDLPFDETGRANSMELICNGTALEIGTGDTCLDAILLLSNRDVEAGRPLGIDVLRAIHSLAYRILHSSDSHPVHEIDHEFGVDAKHIMHLRDVLDSVPEDSRTLQYYEAYAWIVGPKRKSYILGKALELRSDNGQAWLDLAETYMALEQYTEAEAVYQHITMIFGGKDGSDDVGEESHATTARQRISDLKIILSENGEWRE